MKYNFSVYIEKRERIDMFLVSLFPELSRSYIQKLIDSGCVKVNNETTKKNTKLENHDEIYIEEIITSTEILAEDIPLEIIYEDENICVINKNFGINVHPTPGIEGKKGTMVNALLHHCRNALPVISGEQRPGIVHRLDKDTTGVIITAKNDTYMKEVSAKIKAREVKKYYIAIVAGVITQQKFTIKSDIGRHPSDKIKMTVSNPLNPKHAITHGEVLGYVANEYSVVRVDLETGRTHQIRVHLASIGYPILGDSVYGNSKVNKRVATLYQIHRQMLHAREFHIELYGQKQKFIAPLYPDMRAVLEGEIEL